MMPVGMRRARVPQPALVASNRCMNVLIRLLPHTDLLHEVLVVPEQPFMIHGFARPVANRRHAEREALACRLDELAYADRHGLGEGAGHHAGDAGERAGAEADGVRLDLDVGCEDEQFLQVVDVLVDALGLVPVGPCHEMSFAWLSCRRSHFWLLKTSKSSVSKVRRFRST